MKNIKKYFTIKNSIYLSSQYILHFSFITRTTKEFPVLLTEWEPKKSPTFEDGYKSAMAISISGINWIGTKK